MLSKNIQKVCEPGTGIWENRSKKSELFSGGTLTALWAHRDGPEVIRIESIGYSWVINDAAAHTTPPGLGDSSFLCRGATSSDPPAEMWEPTNCQPRQLHSGDVGGFSTDKNCRQTVMIFFDEKLFANFFLDTYVNLKFPQDSKNRTYKIIRAS